MSSFRLRQSCDVCRPVYVCGGLSLDGAALASVFRLFRWCWNVEWKTSGFCCHSSTTCCWSSSARCTPSRRVRSRRTSTSLVTSVSPCTRRVSSGSASCPSTSAHTIHFRSDWVTRSFCVQRTAKARHVRAPRQRRQLSVQVSHKCITIRYDTIRYKSLTWTRKLSI